MKEDKPAELPNDRSGRSGLRLRRPPNLQEFVENLRQEGESDEALIRRLDIEDQTLPEEGEILD